MTTLDKTTNTAAGVELDPEDILLLILEANGRILHKKTLSGITRLEKLVFLLNEETDFEEVESFFPFKAYHYGPFSKEIYEAIDFLEGYSFVDVTEKDFSLNEINLEEAELLNEISESGAPDFQGTPELGARERTFSLTEQGRELSTALRNSLQGTHENNINAVDHIVEKYGKLPLNQLIRYVYRRYPHMAEKSIHPIASEIG